MPDSNPWLARLLRFRGALDHLIQDVAAGTDASHRGPPCPLDVVVDAEVVVVSADLPGVQPGSLAVTVCGDRLVLSGARRAPIGDFTCAERPVGPFEREVTLPACADGRRARARYAQGVLTITLPRVVDRRGAEHDVPVELEA